MILYLVRHATQDMTDDADPGLSDYGRLEARMAAGTLRHARPEVVYHSQKARARQTAEIIGQSCGSRLEEAQGLKPNDDVSVWVEKLSSLPYDELMIVGHMPFLGLLVEKLLADKSRDLPVRFDPATCVILLGKDGNWEFKGIHTP